MEDGTLAPSSGRWLKSGMGSPTRFLTLNTSEWPKDAAVCSLSDTLEIGAVPQRFFLSAKACQESSAEQRRGGKVAPAVTTGPPFSRTGNERVECEAIVPMQTVAALDTQCGMQNQNHQTLNSGHYVIERDVMGTLTTRTFTALGARDVEEGALLLAIGFTHCQSSMAVMEESCPTPD